MRCDKIFVIDKGEFVESGSHKELIDKKGFYYDLWKEQLPEITEKAIEKEDAKEKTPFVPFVGGFDQSAAVKDGESK